MRRTQVLMGAGGLIAAALIGGTLISAALATPITSPITSPDANVEGGEYCEVYLDALATELGVDRAALVPAQQAAMTAVVDAMLADELIDEERATELRERIAEIDEADCNALGHRSMHRGRGDRPGHGPGFGRGLPFGDGLEAAATALGLEERELIGAFVEGSTLEEIAEAEGVAYDVVTSAVTDAVRAELDDAVGDEDITQERADEILADVAEWLEDGGEPLRGGHGFRRR